MSRQGMELTALTAIFIVILFIVFFAFKANYRKAKYDERQEAIRNRSFKYGFIAIIAAKI